MRLFYAVSIPGREKILLGRIQSKLNAPKDIVKWVEPENFHFTLCFLGEIPQEKLAALKQIGEAVGKFHSPFEISLNGLGAFPPKGAPRILWVDTEKGRDNLSAIAKAIQERVIALGIPQEPREFQPHATIGRVRNPKQGKTLRETLQSETFTSTAWLCDSFALKQSKLSSAGPSYTDVLTFPLLN